MDKEPKTEHNLEILVECRKQRVHLISWIFLKTGGVRFMFAENISCRKSKCRTIRNGPCATLATGGNCAMRRPAAAYKSKTTTCRTTYNGFAPRSKRSMTTIVGQFLSPSMPSNKPSDLNNAVNRDGRWERKWEVVVKSHTAPATSIHLPSQMRRP